MILETHGGIGKIWQACYSDVKAGVVFEKDEKKADVLARQRPGWAVFESDCVEAVRGGATKPWEINFLDLDPYGEPWPILDAFLIGHQPETPLLAVAVNDGLRNKLKLNGAWTVASMQGVVQKYGNGIYKRYLEICEELIREKAVQSGYELRRFWGYYCGRGQDMTHYAALLARN